MRCAVFLLLKSVRCAVFLTSVRYASFTWDVNLVPVLTVMKSYYASDEMHSFTGANSTIAKVRIVNNISLIDRVRSLNRELVPTNSKHEQIRSTN